MATAPLISCYVGERQDKNLEEILNFFYRKNIKVPDYISPHASTKTGLDNASKTKFKNALKDALNDRKISEKECTKYTNKLVFTGHEDVEEIADVGDSATDIDIDEDDGSFIETIIEIFDNLF